MSQQKSIFMFKGVEHMFKGVEQLFKGVEQLFSVLEHKNISRVPQKTIIPGVYSFARHFFALAFGCLQSLLYFCNKLSEALKADK